MHWHSSCDHQFERPEKKVIELVFGHVGKATLKTKVFMRSNVLGCLEAGYCWFYVEFFLAMINHYEG